VSSEVLLAFTAAIIGGALRVGVPFLFVSLGECLTEKAGRINLGLEGVLVLSAMAGFGGAYLSGSPWIGALVAACAGAAVAVAVGIAAGGAAVGVVAGGLLGPLVGLAVPERRVADTAR